MEDSPLNSWRSVSLSDGLDSFLTNSQPQAGGQPWPGLTPSSRTASFEKGLVKFEERQKPKSPSFGAVVVDDIQVWLQRLEEVMLKGLQKVEEIGEKSMRRQSEVEGNLVRHLDELVGSSKSRGGATSSPSPEELSRLISDATRRAVDTSVLDLESRLKELVSKQEQFLQKQEVGAPSFEARKLENLAKQAAEACANGAVKDLGRVLKSRFEETETGIVRRLEQSAIEVSDRLGDRLERSSDSLRSAVQADLANLSNRNEVLSEKLREFSRTNVDVLEDLRRLNLSLQQVTGQQDRFQQGMSRLNEFSSVIEVGFERLTGKLVLEMQGGSPGSMEQMPRAAQTSSTALRGGARPEGSQQTPRRPMTAGPEWDRGQKGERFSGLPAAAAPLSAAAAATAAQERRIMQEQEQVARENKWPGAGGQEDVALAITQVPLGDSIRRPGTAGRERSSRPLQDADGRPVDSSRLRALDVDTRSARGPGASNWGNDERLDAYRKTSARGPNRAVEEARRQQPQAGQRTAPYVNG